MKRKFKDYLNLLYKRLLDKDDNKKIVTRFTYATLFIVSAVMTVLNIITNIDALSFATGTFAILCLINFGITFFGKNWYLLEIYL